MKLAKRKQVGDSTTANLPNKHDFFKKRPTKQCTATTDVKIDEDAALPSFLGWTFACLGLTAHEEAKVETIVRLHQGRMEDGDRSGSGRRNLRRLTTCSHVVTGYWFPVTPLAGDSVTYVSLHWLEQVHAMARSIPHGDSILFQPPPFQPSATSAVLAYPPTFQDTFDPTIHVELPCAPASVLCDGIPRWPYMVALLARPIPDMDALEKTIHLITGRSSPLRCLRQAVLDHTDSALFFRVTLPYMLDLALALPHLFPSPVPLMTKQATATVALTKRQVACLVVHAFLCTFPSASDSFNHFHFFDLFAPAHAPSWSDANDDATMVQKIATVLHYFARVAADNAAPGASRYDQQRVAYSRCVLDVKEARDVNVPWSPVHVHSNGAIEGHVGALQVDFANKFAGGGVLGHGCVQEEIRFVINPECLVACLVTEVLDSNECFVVHGTEQYAAYSGYGSTFTFAGDVKDSVAIDSNGVRDTVIVGIDANKYYRNNAWHQYRPEDIKRELDKATVGFQRLPDEGESRRPVATGNWGCGVFNGDVELKFVLQWLAASAQGRPMHYYTFGASNLANRIDGFVHAVVASAVSVHDLRTRLLDAQSPTNLGAYMRHHRRNKQTSVFAYITSTVLNDANAES